MSRLFDELREGESYANVSFEESKWFDLKMKIDEHNRNNEQERIEYHLHYIKQKNEVYKEDETLQKLYKKKKQINKEISIREQNLNQSAK